MQTVLQVLIIFLSALSIGGCVDTPEPTLIQGGLYSIEDGRGEYRAAKLLAYDSSTVNLVLYSNRYVQRPDTIMADSLRRVSRSGELSSREHFAANRRLFRAWEPELAGIDSVTLFERQAVEQWMRGSRRAAGE